MKKTILFTLSGLLSLNILAQCPGSGTDVCNAISVPVGTDCSASNQTVMRTNSCGHFYNPGTCNSTDDYAVWATFYVSGTSRDIEITYNPSNSKDIVMHLFSLSGDCSDTSNLTEIACADDNPVGTGAAGEETITQTLAGGTYYVRIVAIGASGTGSASYLCVYATTETCIDGIQNQGETGVDCGGPCSPCVSADYKRGYHWFFGDSAGLDFSSGSPVFAAGPLVSFEGAASISDRNGNLLCFTNGGGRDPACSGGQAAGVIWDANGDPMPNGTMLGHEGGGNSSAQSSVIIPKPGTTDRYYVFTTVEKEFFSNTGVCVTGTYPGKGLHYFEVDMTQNGGLGDVIVFDSILVPTWSECLTATIHANGTDYWLAIQDTAWDINIIEVNSSGIQSPVSYSTPTINFTYKFSPDGTMLNAAEYLYDFNNSTGVISNERSITLESNDRYRNSFSPNSRFLYSSNNSGEVYQHDVSLGSQAAINSSKTLVGTLASTGHDKQIGPDGNIYIAHYGKNYLSVINCPNASGSDCDVQSSAIALTNKCEYGLPNFVDAWFASDDSCGAPSGTPTPVDFVSFTGHNENNENMLSWKTAAEINNDYYVIKRAGADLNYEKLAQIQGAGNSGNTQEYTFRDVNPLAGVNYYALFQVDFDGTTEYLATVTLTNREEDAVQVFNRNNGYISVVSDNHGTRRVQIYTHSGTLVKSIHTTGNENTINVRNLANGCYIVKILQDDRTYSNKIVIIQ